MNTFAADRILQSAGSDLRASSPSASRRFDAMAMVRRILQEEREKSAARKAEAIANYHETGEAFITSKNLATGKEVKVPVAFRRTVWHQLES